MAFTDEQYPGQSVAARISTAVVRLMHDYTGRGPTKARTTINDGLVTVLLGGGLLPAERRLVAEGQSDVVLELRRRFQQVMEDDLSAAVSQMTGRRVIAFMSTNHLDPDLMVEVFVLEPRLGGEGDGATVGERAGQLGEDRQVGVEPNPVRPANR